MISLFGLGCLDVRCMHYSKPFRVGYPLIYIWIRQPSNMWESLWFQCLGDLSERALEAQVFLLHAPLFLTPGIQCLRKGRPGPFLFCEWYSNFPVAVF